MTKDTALQIWPVFAIMMAICVWVVIVSLRQVRHSKRISDLEIQSNEYDRQSKEFSAALSELRGLVEQSEIQLNRIEGKLDVLVDRS